MIKFWIYGKLITTPGLLAFKFSRAVLRVKRAKMRELRAALVDATPVDTGEARDGWEIVEDSIRNPADHIRRLNEGSSTQAPERFIEKTLLSHKGVSPSGTIVRSR
jgi:hypothetical protein